VRHFRQKETFLQHDVRGPFKSKQYCQCYVQKLGQYFNRNSSSVVFAFYEAVWILSVAGGNAY